MTPGEAVDVAIVGAGPAGTTLAAALARRGVEVVVLERSPSWHWRAGGVFTSPAAVAALRRAGLPAATIDAVTRPIPAMRLETPAGTIVRLTYGADTGGPTGGRLRPIRARSGPGTAGARCRGDGAVAGSRSTTVRLRDRTAGTPANVIDLGERRARRADRRRRRRHALVVARAAGVARPPRLPPRVGLTWHVVDPRPTHRSHPQTPGWSSAATPTSVWRRVPGRAAQHRRRPRSVVARRRSPGTVPRATVRGVLATIPAPRRRPRPSGRQRAVCDPIAGASPLGVRVTRRAGPGWFLVGDAAGFLDPFTGEGLHRALVSTELAARAIPAALARDGRDAGARGRRLRPGDAPPVRGEGRGLVARPDVPRATAPLRVRRATARRTPRRPCDDGPRDGRPRSRPRAPSIRASSRRSSPRELPRSRSPEPGDTGPSRGLRRGP